MYGVIMPAHYDLCYKIKYYIARTHLMHVDKLYMEWYREPFTVLVQELLRGSDASFTININ